MRFTAEVTFLNNTKYDELVKLKPFIEQISLLINNLEGGEIAKDEDIEKARRLYETLGGQK